MTEYPGTFQHWKPLYGATFTASHRTVPYLAWSPTWSLKRWPFVRAAAVPVLATITPQRKAAMVFTDIPASIRSLPAQHDLIAHRPWQLAGPNAVDLARCAK